MLFALRGSQVLHEVPSQLVHELRNSGKLFSRKLLGGSCGLPRRVAGILGFRIARFVQVNLIFTDLIDISDLVGIFRHDDFLFCAPLSVRIYMLMRLVGGLRIFRSEFFQLLNPFGLLVLPFLLLQRILHGPVEVLRTEGLQYPVSGFQVLDFVQLGEIGQGGTALFGFLEAVAVQFQQLDAPPDSGLGEPRLVGDLLHCLPEVHHHLEALRLFVDGEV